MFPIFQDQGWCYFCEVGIEFQTFPLNISGKIVAYNINPKAQGNDHPPGPWTMTVKSPHSPGWAVF